MKHDSRFLPRHALILIALLMLSLPPLARAATLAVAADGSGQYPTIQAAVTAAVDGDTVLLGDGTYSGDGDRDIDFAGKSLTVTSQNGAAKTIMDCGGVADTQYTHAISHRGFYLHSSEMAAVISGLTIENGYEAQQTGNMDTGYGGGICIRGASVAIKNCVIMGNTAEDYGGGIYNFTGNNLTGVGTNAITMTGCTVTGNVAHNGGGGVYNVTYILSDTVIGTINLTNCIITGNSARMFRPGATPYTSSGGGVQNYCYGPHSTISMVRCTVSGNVADATGGGVDNSMQTSGTVTMAACTVSGNTSLYSDGGGVRVSMHGGAMTLTNCVLTGNIAQGNGGGFADSNRGPNSSIRLTNCTSSANTVQGSGGGIYNDNDANTSFALTNCILFGDAGAEVLDSAQQTANIGAYACDIQGGYPGGNLNADPLFVYAAGGNFRLKPGSPCLGAGTAAGAPPTDRDGTTRPAPPSIGAYEVATAHAHILWRNPDGRATLWQVNPDGSYRISQTYGPYTDAGGMWQATALATGPDGVSRILWRNPDGQATLWRVNADSSFSPGPSYGPYTDTGGTWQAVACSVGPDNAAHILWRNPDGQATLWRVNPDASFSPGPSYGPYTDAGGTWQAAALATGPDGVSRILWRNPDGRATLWHVYADGSTDTSAPYGRYTDIGGTWQATAVSVGPDNVAHILWHNPDGRATLWQVNADGSFRISQTYGPYTDAGGLWQAVALAAGPDIVSRLLWRNPDGRATLWQVNADGSFHISVPYGPYTDAGGTWQAVADSAGP